MPIGYRCGDIGDYTGGRRSEARVAWRVLDYEYRELGNRHILTDVAKFLGIRSFGWKSTLAEFHRRYGDAKGIWLSTTRSHSKEYYGEYGYLEKVAYERKDVVLDMVDEVYVIDRRNPTLRIPIKSGRQLGHLFEAQKHLRMAGVGFDTGT